MNKRGPKPLGAKSHVLDVAVALARIDGYRHVTREELAKSAGVSVGMISKYFGTMVHLRRAIMSAAVSRGDLVIIAQGLVVGDPKARVAPDSIKRQAVNALL